MEETILLSEALDIFHSGVLCDISYVTADRKRHNYGDYKELKRVCKLNGQPSPEVEAYSGDSFKFSKDPAHKKNKTINAWDPFSTDKRIYKIHYRLIHLFNGKRLIQ